MNVLLLSRYGNLGASSRIRSYQYLPYLREQGIDVTLAPLLLDDYLRDLYAGKSPGVVSILTAYARRLAALMRHKKFDLLWIEYELFPWLPGWLESLMMSNGTPCLVDYDDAIFHRYDQHPNHWVRRLLGHKIDTVMRLASVVVVGNEYLREHAIQAGARRVEVLPTSIDLGRYVSPMPVHNALFTIGWIGSPSTTRYLHLVHEALAEVCAHNQARVVLIGASELGWVNIPHVIQPWSEDSEVVQLSGFDVGIMPLEDSPWERGKCGYKLIQYMACGRPVIASPVGVNTRIVEHGINGYLAETPRDWVQALTALKSNADLRQQMGTAGRAKVERDYTVQVNAPRLAALLRDAARQA